MSLPTTIITITTTTAHQEAAMRYCLADHGLVFSTRDRGARMLADFRAKTGDQSMASVAIDFSGVRSVSYSFVDEFIGELMKAVATADDAPALVNVPASAARTIERSLRRRGLSVERLMSDALQAA